HAHLALASSLRPLGRYSVVIFYCHRDHRDLHSFPTRRSSDLLRAQPGNVPVLDQTTSAGAAERPVHEHGAEPGGCLAAIVVLHRSEEHTSELQSRENLVCRLLLEKKKKTKESERTRGEQADSR